MRNTGVALAISYESPREGALLERLLQPLSERYPGEAACSLRQLRNKHYHCDLCTV